MKLIRFIVPIFVFFTIFNAQAILPVDVFGTLEMPNAQKFQGVTLGGFSGMYYLEGADKLVAIQDKPSVNPLGPTYLVVWQIKRNGPTKYDQVGFALAGVLELGKMPSIFDWSQYCDVEAVARLPQGQWLVSSEGGYLNTHAEILRFDDKLQYLDRLPLVDFFRPMENKGVQKNQSLEAMTASPSGQLIYASNEMPLGQDLINGRQTWVRVVRFRQNKKQNYEPIDWAYYQLQPESYNGLVEFAAIGERQLYALERAYNPATNKNTIRVFLVEFPPVGAILGDEQGPILYKRLVVDLDDLKYQLPESFKHLDNFEGMALGKLSGGKRELYLISDDNFSPQQKTLLLGLRVPEPLPGDIARPMNVLKSKQGM